jgi:hypothetical protein
VLAEVLHTLIQLAVSPASVTALAAVVFGAVTLAILLVIVARVLAGATALPLRRRASAFRANSRRTAFLRLRDPDARGRTRPRAPTAAPAAAASLA